MELPALIFLIEMKSFVHRMILFGLIFSFIACDHATQKTKPCDYFSAGQEEAILRQIVLKTAKKPDANAGSPEAEAWYSEQVKAYNWHFAHEESGRLYYFVSRPAPSLYGKRIGLGGSFESPDRLRITSFKESFHTFKMKPEDLLQKGAILFEKLVNRQDLTQYEPGKKGKEEWIEFPDYLNYYDSTSQSWRMRSI